MAHRGCAVYLSHKLQCEWRPWSPEQLGYDQQCNIDIYLISVAFKEEESSDSENVDENRHGNGQAQHTDSKNLKCSEHEYCIQADRHRK